FQDADGLTSLLNQLSHAPDELSAAQQRSLERARIFSGSRMATGYEHLFRHWIKHAEGTRLCPAVSA
ncbi:MAG TPA: hypothetical protein VJS11_11710, partial [Acidobacteriaceae bacterium]|nr:hypothetical protein [Acidobacteriaceae bacterium]